MAIDPSIIGNVMVPQTPQLPDVNAMMQTRTAGMENIYKLETARQEQAKLAQQEQQAAIAQMMLPSVAAAFSDPSDAGLAAAASLLPPEVADTFAPFMDRLRGVPDPKLRQAMLRAELLKDDEGKLILAQLEPTANMRLQADTAAQAQAVKMRELQLREQEAAAKAAQTAPISTEQPPDETAAPPMDPKVKLKLDQAYPQASRALQSSVTSIDQDIQDVERLLSDEVGLKAITGYLGAYTPNVFKDATRAQALLDKIMSGAGFSALQAMRDASPTGGALGNVSNQEGAKLEKSVAAFSQAQDYDDFRNALRQYLIDLKMAQENVQAAFDETYSYRGETPSEEIVTQTKERRKRIEEEVLPQRKTNLPPGVTIKRN